MACRTQQNSGVFFRPLVCGVQKIHQSFVVCGRPLQGAAHNKTLVYFFAPWCAVCKVSMPSLNLLSGDDLRVVVIALDWQNQAEVEDFVRSSGFQGEVLLGTAGTMQRWQIDAFPSYYVVGRDGKVLHRDRGFTTPPGLLLRTR